MGSAKANKRVVREFIETVLNEGKLGSIHEFLAADSIQHELDGTDPAFGRGPEAFAQFVALYLDAFPDLRVDIESQVAEDDQVVTRWRMEGTHKYPLMGIGASGHAMSVDGIRIDRMAEGKIRESWVQWDILGMLQQIGALPELNRNPGATTDAATIAA